MTLCGEPWRPTSAEMKWLRVVDMRADRNIRAWESFNFNSKTHKLVGQNGFGSTTDAWVDCFSSLFQLPLRAMQRPMRFSSTYLGLLCLLCLSWIMCHQTNFSQVRTQLQRQGSKQKPDEATKLIQAIKCASTAEQLMNILDYAVDDPIFDENHVSAAYSRLAILTSRGGPQAPFSLEEEVLPRLHDRVRKMDLEFKLGARAVANVLWSIGKLYDWSLKPEELLDALLESIQYFARGMDEQQLSKCLWAAARLREWQIVSALAAAIPRATGKMTPQSLSNCLWALNQFTYEPNVLRALESIVDHFPNKAKDMTPRQRSKCLSVFLQLVDDVPEAFVSVLLPLATEVPPTVQQMRPAALSESLRALLQLLHTDPDNPCLDPYHPCVDLNLCERIQLCDFVKDVARCAADRFLSLKLSKRDVTDSLPVVLWACSEAGSHHDELLESVEKVLGSRRKLSTLSDYNAAILWASYQQLDRKQKFLDFRKLLKSELRRRRITKADVESCRNGRAGWNRGWDRD